MGKYWSFTMCWVCIMTAWPSLCASTRTWRIRRPRPCNIFSRMYNRAHFPPKPRPIIWTKRLLINSVIPSETRNKGNGNRLLRYRCEPGIDAGEKDCRDRLRKPGTGARVEFARQWLQRSYRLATEKQEPRTGDGRGLPGHDTLRGCREGRCDYAAGTRSRSPRDIRTRHSTGAGSRQAAAYRAWVQSALWTN